MNRDRWQKVKKIFDAALTVAPNERKPFLDNACGNDDGLRREVEKLLDSFADDSFMEQPAAAEVASVIIKAETKHLEAGKCFGHYEVIRQIGAGGMGEVYLAQDTRLDRLVAVKILNENFAKNESNLIDDSLAEAHTVLGWVGFLYDWDWENAERELKRAIELAPNNSEAYRAYAHLLSNSGRHNKAFAEIRRARELDPLTLITSALEGQFLFYAGRSDEVIVRLNKTLEIDPNFWVAHNALGRVYILQKRYDEAIAALTKAKELSGGSTEPVTQLGYALAKSGRREQAQATLAELKSFAAEKFVPTYNFAMIYNGLGEREEALNYLEKSFQEREVQMAFIKIDTRWNEFRAEPRFVEIIKEMNLE
ncbi:MAG: tetratricopeptide repeat protein [Pyrinomonadaceae bacterium]